jgi:hypothetical protein
MIAFVSLFLGLVVGVVPVTVLVEKPVAAVRYELDGKPVGRVERAPWTLPLDFGEELVPHELVARALNAAGKEIGVARQFVNLPRPPAEVEVVLERDLKGRATAARFSGQSLIGPRPARVTATFDAAPLPAGEPGRVALPDYDENARHVLSVELEFSPTVRSRTDVVLGGAETGVVRSELTAVVVRKTAPGNPPAAEELAGAFAREGRPVPVVAVEEGPAIVCVVRGPSVRMALKSLGTGGRTTLALQPGGQRLPRFDRDASRSAMTLEKGDRLRFIWPMPRAIASSPGSELFDRSRDFAGADAGLAWLLTRVEHPEQHPREVRLADAAAVAGLEATASGSRRAVVLVLGDETADRSRHSPDSIRRYLQTIRVPFTVWSLKSLAAQPLAKSWGEVEDVSSADRLEKAVERLKADLAAQRVVWVQGRFIPQEITLSDKAVGIELAR